MNNDCEKDYFETNNDDTREVLEITEVKKTNKHNIRKQLAILLVIGGLITAGTGIAKIVVSRTYTKPKTKSTHYDPIEELYNYTKELREKEKQELNGFLLFASSIIPMSLGAALKKSSKDDEYDEDYDVENDDEDDYALNLAINHMNGTPLNPMVHSDFSTNLTMSQFMKDYQNNNGGLNR